MNNDILTVNNITFNYPENSPLFNEFSLNVNNGDFISIIGPSGSGKTTLFRILTGYKKISSGSISINGHNLYTLTNSVRSKTMAVVPQEFHTPMPYTVGQIVGMGRVSSSNSFIFTSKEDSKKNLEALEFVNMQKYSRKLFNNLSGGEKQRVMIAMALAQEPQILLMDEPTASLDIKLKSEIMRNIKSLNEDKKITVIIITHDIQLAAQYCKRIVLIKDGSIIADGPAENVISPEIIEKTYNCKVTVISQNEKIYISAH